MANVKISQLPAATTPLDTSVIFPVVQGGVTKQSALSSLGFTQVGSSTARTMQAKLRESVSIADFGAVGDGVTDDTVAVQAFFDAVTSNGYAGSINPGTYKITAPIKINIGADGFSITGPASGAAVFSVASTFAGGAIALQMDGVGNAVGWEVGGFDVSGTLGSVGSATVGFQIGDAATVAIDILGYQFSTVVAVQVTGFATNWKVVHARMIEFRNCSAWNTSLTATNQTNLAITQAGAFTGDLRFYNCQYVTKTVTGNNNVSITSPSGPYSNVTGFGNVAGIKFIACDFYAGEKGMYIYASNAAWISDIWVIAGCQFDQATTNAIWVESFDASTNIEDIHFTDIYVSQSTSSQVTFTSTGTGGNIRSAWLTQSSLSQGLGFAVNIAGAACSGIHVLANEVVDCDGTVAIEVSGATDVKVRGNRHRTGLLGVQPDYLVQIESGTTKIDVTENSGQTAVAIINDLSGSTPIKVINNNGGYNPRPQATITLTGSPYTHTNTSGAPQLVSIVGGTFSAVTVDGLTLTTVANMLVPVPPGVNLVLTYTVAPTVKTLGL